MALSFLSWIVMLRVKRALSRGQTASGAKISLIHICTGRTNQLQLFAVSMYDCRNDVSTATKLKLPDGVSHTMHQERQHHLEAFQHELDPELHIVHQRYGQGGAEGFARRLHGKLRLPRPFLQQSLQLPGYFTLPVEAFEEDSAQAHVEAFHSKLRASAGMLLLAVTKSITHAAAYQEYPILTHRQPSKACAACQQKTCAMNQQPLISFADFEDADTVTCVAHLALLVRKSKRTVVQQLQLLSEPSFRDIPASLSIKVNTVEDSVLSLRLNVRQPSGSKAAEVCCNLNMSDKGQQCHMCIVSSSHPSLYSQHTRLSQCF